MKLSEAIKIIKGLIASVELAYKSNPLTDKEAHPAIDALNLAISALEKQEADRWIPVTERLPGKTGTYIVTTQTGAVTTARFYEARSIPAQMWREAYDRPACWQSNRKVTHWMPLPELPKDGGAENA